jgi:hypothetical protein
MKNMFTVLKKAALFCLPFIAILAWYLIADPFMVLYNHEDYNKDYFVDKNLDFITTEVFMKNMAEVDYNSFIFGGSTSLYTTPTDWKKHLEADSEVFAFNASGEHITGIWSKIKYIKSQEHQIKNALLVIDTDATFGRFVNDNPIFMKHFEVYPSSKLNFHYKYFLNFINIRYLVPYVHYRIGQTYYPYMSNMLKKESYYYDPLSNEYHNVGILEELKSDSLNYYESRKGRFGVPKGPGYEASPGIKQDDLDMLSEIRDIFSQDGTDFSLLICPAYNQIAFNREDLAILQDLFGSENVFDFSRSEEITGNKSNYYDEFHFKRYVGDMMLGTIYSP